MSGDWGTRTLALVMLVGLSSCGASTSIFARAVSLKLMSAESAPEDGTDEEVHIRRVADYFEHQHDPRSCWAASLTTLLNYLNYPTSQETLLKNHRILRHDECTVDQGLIRLPCDETIVSAIRDEILDASMSAIRGWVSTNDSDTVVKASFDPVETLSDGLPFLLLLSFGGEGHAYTVVGARYRRSDHALYALFVLDPSFNWKTESSLPARRLSMGHPAVYVLKPSRRAHMDGVTFACRTDSR